MATKTRKSLEARAGLVLLRAALKLKSGELKRADAALRAALRELGMTRAELRRVLGARSDALGALLKAPRRKRPLRHPMR